jgi:hypothetical protein
MYSAIRISLAILLTAVFWTGVGLFLVSLTR